MAFQVNIHEAKIVTADAAIGAFGARFPGERRARCRPT